MIFPFGSYFLFIIIVIYCRIYRFSMIPEVLWSVWLIACTLRGMLYIPAGTNYQENFFACGDGMPCICRESAQDKYAFRIHIPLQRSGPVNLRTAIGILCCFPSVRSPLPCISFVCVNIIHPVINLRNGFWMQSGSCRPVCCYRGRLGVEWLYCIQGNY